MATKVHGGELPLVIIQTSWRNFVCRERLALLSLWLCTFGGERGEEWEDVESFERTGLEAQVARAFL